jgi:serine/threonine-protein kinase RsbW
MVRSIPIRPASDRTRQGASVERNFKRELDALGEVFDFLLQFARQNGLDESVSYVLNLAVEELFTNMVKYSPDGAGEIPISIRREGSRLMVTLVDRDVEKFDITRPRSEVIDGRLRERKPGGLGLHLVQQMVDEIRYDYRDRRSEVTIVKRLESEDV